VLAGPSFSQFLWHGCVMLQAELAVQGNPAVQGVYLIFNATKPVIYTTEYAFGGPILPGSQPPSSASA